MLQSILDSTKKSLGLDADYDEFDLDIIVLINSSFSTLHGLGVGPEEAFMIESASTTWDEFLMGDARYNSVRTYVYLKVRLMFDPPTIASVASAMQEQTKELEFRLNVIAENDKYQTTPISRPLDGGNVFGDPSRTSLFDGGGPSHGVSPSLVESITPVVYVPPVSDPNTVTVYDGGSP